MPAAKKLSDLNISNRTTVKIRGTVSYSRIGRKIDGEELKRANTFTRFPSAIPYYKMTIEINGPVKDALIFDPSSDSEVNLAAYIASRVYSSRKEENIGKQFFSCISKAGEIRIYQKKDATTVTPVRLNGNELAPGVPVELELQYFQAKMGPGVGLNAVIVDGEIRTYAASAPVKGYTVGEGEIVLPPRSVSVHEDIASADGISTEMPVSEIQSEIDAAEPVGTSTAPSSASFDSLLQQFRAGR